eukprot:c13132_g1_i2.p1 GENE.c13132_g1_i2~~c13132_g1_i2.p1  ORF type:complete len:193 (-),score=40.44 c13132_g1_i2:252-830(-)
MYAVEASSLSENGLAVFRIVMGHLSQVQTQFAIQTVDKAGWSFWHYAAKHHAITEDVRERWRSQFLYNAVAVSTAPQFPLLANATNSRKPLHQRETWMRQKILMNSRARDANRDVSRSNDPYITTLNASCILHILVESFRFVRLVELPDTTPTLTTRPTMQTQSENQNGNGNGGMLLDEPYDAMPRHSLRHE